MPVCHGLDAWACGHPEVMECWRCRTAATEEELAAAASVGARTPIAIILEPSKDLARQTHDIVVDMARHLP